MAGMVVVFHARTIPIEEAEIGRRAATLKRLLCAVWPRAGPESDSRAILARDASQPNPRRATIPGTYSLCGGVIGSGVAFGGPRGGPTSSLISRAASGDEKNASRHSTRLS